MRMLEIVARPNGAHNNQTYHGALPDGWAVIPDTMGTLENFPFGDVTVEEIDGALTVTGWIPGALPKPVEKEKEPTTEDIINAMLGVSE